MPEKYLPAIVQYARCFKYKSFADTQKMFSEQKPDLDIYEDKIMFTAELNLSGTKMRILIDTNSGLFFHRLPNTSSKSTKKFSIPNMFLFIVTARDFYEKYFKTSAM